MKSERTRDAWERIKGSKPRRQEMRGMRYGQKGIGPNNASGHKGGMGRQGSRRG